MAHVGWDYEEDNGEYHVWTNSGPGDAMLGGAFFMKLKRTPENDAAVIRVVGALEELTIRKAGDQPTPK